MPSTNICDNTPPEPNKDGYYGYDSGSGDGLFESPPDPIMDAAKLAMQKFAPSGDRQQRVRDYFRGKDKNASGKVTDWGSCVFADMHLSAPANSTPQRFSSQLYTPILLGMRACQQR